MKKIIVFSDIHLNSATDETLEKSSQKLEKAIVHLQSYHKDFDNFYFHLYHMNYKKLLIMK